MMKQNPQFVNGYKAPRYLCKVARDSWPQRIIWWLFRRYLLNEDYYRLTRRYSGPRPRGTSSYSTTKGNATAFRYYVEARSRRRPALSIDIAQGAPEWLEARRKRIADAT